MGSAVHCHSERIIFRRGLLQGLVLAFYSSAPGGLVNGRNHGRGRPCHDRMPYTGFVQEYVCFQTRLESAGVSRLTDRA
jgi:hypothetical protein